MAVTITSIADNDLRVFGGIPLNENMYTMGQVETRLSGVTANVAEMISTAISTVWKAGGSVEPSGQSGLVYESPSTGMWEAPLAIAENEGKVYHVTSDFDITSGAASHFKEGVGTHIEAGTDVAVVYSGMDGVNKIYIYDVLAVTDSSVVKSLKLGTSSGTELTPENGVAVIPMAEAPVEQGDGSSGLMSAADKEKLNALSTSAEENQNAFSHIRIGTSSGLDVAADSKTDTFILSGSAPITICGNAESDTVTVYHDYQGPQGGATAGDSSNQTPTWGDTFKAVKVVVNGYGHVTDADEHTVTIPSAVVVASESGSGGSNGLMSAALAEKLSGISHGAEVNQNAFSSVAVQGTSGSSTVTGTASAGSKTDTVTLKAGNNVSMAVSGKVVTINASQPTDIVAGLTLHNMLEANGFTTSGLPSTIESGTLYALISGLHSIDNQHA